MDEGTKYRLLLFSVVLRAIDEQFKVMFDGERLVCALEAIQGMDDIAAGRETVGGKPWTYEMIAELYGQAEALAAEQGRAGYGCGARIERGLAGNIHDNPELLAP